MSIKGLARGADFPCLEARLAVETYCINPISCLSLASVFAAVPTFIYAQEYPKPKDPFDYSSLYRTVLDIDFPADRRRDTFLLISLRSFSSIRYENESQINIRQSNTGQLTVTQYYLPSGSTSISDRLGDLYVEDKLDPNREPAKLAKLFKVEVRTVDISDDVLRGLFAQLDSLHFPIVSLKPETQDESVKIITDGSSYELSYWALMGEMHLNYGNLDLQDGNIKLLGEWLIHFENVINSAPSSPDSAIAGSTGLYRSGLIFGAVVDAENNGIPNASVTVIDKKASRIWPTIQTDALGTFMVPDLQPGEYAVTVEASNPKIRATKNVTVIPARQAWFQLKSEGHLAH